jgi:hypothetical protein
MHLIEQAMGELALEFEPPEIRYSEGGASDRFPEFSQFLDALPRRIPAIRAEFAAPIEIPATQSGCKFASARA